MLSPATSAATIGRARELEALRAAQAASRSGTPGGVVVAGEAGIGKSRLLADFVAGLPSDVVVARGQCVAMGSITTPFAPLRGLLRDLVDRLGASTLMAAAGPTGRLLPAVLPELSAEPAGEISQEQLHDVVSVLLESVSSVTPVVAIVEDVHWADVATLDLLRSLLQTLRRGQLLMVLSYRTDDVGRGHPLRPFLTELDRARGVGRVELARLTGDEAVEQVRQIRGDLPEPDDLSALIERSDGIPFFVEELLALDAAPDEPLPETLRELVLARYARLTPATQAVLRLVAAGGVTVPHALVSEVHGGESAAFDEAMREAISAHIVTTDGDAYSFRHALTHEAVHDELLPGERSRFHAGYARVLEQQPDQGGRSAEIAHHWLAAHDETRAFAALVAAMREARAAGAPTAAAQLGERALELWSHVLDAEALVGIARLRLSQEVAMSYDEAGDLRALGVLEQALAEAPQEDRRGRALLLHDLMDVMHDHGLRGGLERGRLALALLEDDVDDDDGVAVRARVMCGLGVVLLGDGETGGGQLLEETIELCRSALERIVEPVHAAKVRFELVRALTNASSWKAFRGDVDASLRGYAEALELARPDDPVARLRHDEQLSWLLLQLGRHLDAIDVAVRAHEFSRALGMERGWGSAIAVTGARASLAAGDLAGAEALLRRVHDVRPMWTARANCAAAEAELHSLRDDSAGAARALHDAAPMIVELRVGDVDDDLNFAFAVARLALIERGAAAAWPQVEHVWAGAMPRPGSTYPLLALGAQALAELRLAGADPPGISSADAEARLREVMDAVAVWDVADDWRAMLDAELSGVDGTGSDPAAWRTAVDASGRGRLPVRLRARSLRRLAEAQLAAGDHDSAGAALVEAAEFADRHGLVRAARLVGEVASRAGLPRTGRAASARASNGAATLTSRERQVLELVAQGLTNRQIGERLFISDKTVSVHVSAILRKLGAAGRAEAAARAAEVLI